jgi:mono/diheme cytochrome c family protein
MKGFILGVVVTCVVAALGVYIYFSQGMAPVATSAQAMPFEKKLADMALKARVDKEAPNHPPVAADENNLVAAADTYRQNCATCHGLPNQPETVFAKGMFPKPPQLFRGHGVTDDPPGETYWKVANGIRLTGMPSFKPSLSETDMWQVTLLLANADKLPDSVQKLLGGGLQPNAPGGDHSH